MPFLLQQFPITLEPGWLFSSLSWHCKRFVCTKGAFASPLPKFLPLTDTNTCNNPPSACSHGLSQQLLSSMGSSEIGRSGFVLIEASLKQELLNQLLHTGSELKHLCCCKEQAIQTMEQIRGAERARRTILVLKGHDLMFTFKAQVGLQVPKG